MPCRFFASPAFTFLLRVVSISVFLHVFVTMTFYQPGGLFWLQPKASGKLFPEVDIHSFIVRALTDEFIWLLLANARKCLGSFVTFRAI